MLIDHEHSIRNEGYINLINRFDSILGNWEDSEVLDDRGDALDLTCLTEIGLDSGLKSSFGKRHFEDILVLHYVMKVDENIGYGYYIFFVSVIFFFYLVEELEYFDGAYIFLIGFIFLVYFGIIINLIFFIFFIVGKKINIFLFFILKD